MAARPPSELVAIQRDIEVTRAEIAAAVTDLERAAKSLVTTDHWKKAAARSYAQRPEVWLGGAFLLGWWLGAKTFKPRPARIEIT